MQSVTSTGNLPLCSVLENSFTHSVKFMVCICTSMIHSSNVYLVNVRVHILDCTSYETDIECLFKLHIGCCTFDKEQASVTVKKAHSQKMISPVMSLLTTVTVNQESIVSVSMYSCCFIKGQQQWKHMANISDDVLKLFNAVSYCNYICSNFSYCDTLI